MRTSPKAIEIGFSNALSEFDASIKDADMIMSKINIEGGILQRAQRDGTIAKDITAQQKALTDEAAEARKYAESFYQLRLKWGDLFVQQMEYIFGDNPDDGGASLLGAAPAGYEVYLESWKAIVNKDNPAVLNLLNFPYTEHQRTLKAFAVWHEGCRQRLSEMRDSIR